MKSRLVKFSAWLDKVFDQSPVIIQKILTVTLFLPTVVAWFLLPNPWDIIISGILFAPPLIWRAYTINKKRRSFRTPYEQHYQGQESYAQPPEKPVSEDKKQIWKDLDALGLKPNATPEQIKTAFKDAAKDLHADKNPGASDRAKRIMAEEMNRLKEARDRLIKQN